MNMNSTISADNKQQLQVEETDDSCRLQFFEIVPLTRDTGDSCTTQRVSGDWSVEVKQENAAPEQESDVVCCVIYFTIYHSKKSSYSYFVTAIATLLICIT